MVYPAVLIAWRRGGACARGVKRRRRGPGKKCWPIALWQRRRSTSFAHVFQLYGGFLLRAVARNNCALSCCRADAAVLSSVSIARWLELRLRWEYAAAAWERGKVGSPTRCIDHKNAFGRRI